MDRNDASFTRRRAAKLLGAAALSTVPAARVAAPATAGRSWCMRDPHILVGHIDGDFDREMHVYVYSLEEMLNPDIGANGPVHVSVEIPPQYKAKLLDVDEGFLKYGYKVDFQTNGDLRDKTDSVVNVVVRLKAPAHTTLPVQMELVPITAGRSSTIVKGESNRYLRTSCKI